MNKKIDLVEAFDLVNQFMNMTEFYEMIREIMKANKIMSQSEVIEAFIDRAMYHLVMNYEVESVDVSEIAGQVRHIAETAFDCYAMNETMKERKIHEAYYSNLNGNKS